MSELFIVWKGPLVEKGDRRMPRGLPEHFADIAGEPVSVFSGIDAFFPDGRSVPADLAEFNQWKVSAESPALALDVVEWLQRDVDSQAQLIGDDLVGDKVPEIEVCESDLLEDPCPKVDAPLVPPRIPQGLLKPADFRPYQFYLDTEAGVGASAGWEYRGGKGDGIVVADIERGWNYHRDLWKRIGLLRGGTLGDLIFKRGGLGSVALDERAHGTAVLGVVGGRFGRRKIGIRGVAPEAHLMAVPLTASTTSYRLSNAIYNAVASTRIPKGSVLLIESEVPVYLRCSKSPWLKLLRLPLECTSDGLRAVRYAVREGYHVVQVAGNGLSGSLMGVRIDQFAGVTDSGAYVVGASRPFSSVKTRSSNFGAKVTVHAWGNSVVTCGSLQPDRYSDLHAGRDDKDCYTASFDGTSSAAAIVAGAIACVLGVLRAHDVSNQISPAGLKGFVEQSGRRFDHCDCHPIGVQPDVPSVLRTLAAEGLLPPNLQPRGSGVRRRGLRWLRRRR